jgi:plastocyanin
MRQKFSKINNRIVYLLLLILVLLPTLIFCAFYIYNSSNTSSVTHIITLTELGFVPAEITINKGDTVLFKTTQTADFWPASDLHPTHGIYSEFDPQNPVDSE